MLESTGDIIAIARSQRPEGGLVLRVYGVSGPGAPGWKRTERSINDSRISKASKQTPRCGVDQTEPQEL